MPRRIISRTGRLRPATCIFPTIESCMRAKVGGRFIIEVADLSGGESRGPHLWPFER